MTLQGTSMGKSHVTVEAEIGATELQVEDAEEGLRALPGIKNWKRQGRNVP